MAVSMAVAPVSGVYAEDQNAAVENAMNANVQDSAEAGQTEPDANDRQTENSTAADTSQETVKEAVENQPAAGKTQDTMTAQSGTKVENKENSAVKNQAAVQNTQKMKLRHRLKWTVKTESLVILRISAVQRVI